MTRTQKRPQSRWAPCARASCANIFEVLTSSNLLSLSLLFLTHPSRPPLTLFSFAFSPFIETLLVSNPSPARHVRPSVHLPFESRVHHESIDSRIANRNLSSGCLRSLILISLCFSMLCLLGLACLHTPQNLYFYHLGTHYMTKDPNVRKKKLNGFYLFSFSPPLLSFGAVLSAVSMI